VVVLPVACGSKVFGGFFGEQAGVKEGLQGGGTLTAAGRPPGAGQMAAAARAPGAGLVAAAASTAVRFRGR
jgi:hypothetical protein